MDKEIKSRFSSSCFSSSFLSFVGSFLLSFKSFFQGKPHRCTCRHRNSGKYRLFTISEVVFAFWQWRLTSLLCLQTGKRQRFLRMQRSKKTNNFLVNCMTHTDPIGSWQAYSPITLSIFSTRVLHVEVILILVYKHFTVRGCVWRCTSPSDWCDFIYM